MGFNRDGGYGPYELIHENIFFPVDADLDLAEATLLLDVMGTGGHTLDRARLVRPDIGSVLVAGSGPIGLGVAAMARVLFGTEILVFITDVIPYRLKLAEQLGALPVDLREETVEEGLKRHGAGRADVAVDTSGKAAAREACLWALDQRGVLVCVGHGEGLGLEVSRDLIAPERAVLGSEYFPYGDLAANRERLREHRAYLAPIITHRFPVGEIGAAFETFFGGETGKVVVEQ
jgi:threonine dehydrogenase-like Zn-dependent dehydrogenase